VVKLTPPRHFLLTAHGHALTHLLERLVVAFSTLRGDEVQSNHGRRNKKGAPEDAPVEI